MASFSRRVVHLFFLLLLPLLSSGGGFFIERIVNLGDSISDTGNLYRQGGPFGTVFRQLPYGRSFPQGPTGRCSDGKLIIDFIAEGLGVPMLAPYLDDSANFDRGVNFAVAGATALSPESLGDLGITLPFTKSSLQVQLGWFNHYLPGLCSSKQDCSAQFEKTLFLVGEIGGNDYNFALNQKKPMYQVKLLVPMVVNTIMNVAQTLIDNGARNLVVPGNFPIGCLPSHLTLFGNTSTLDESGCATELNDFARFHNEFLQFSVLKLSRLNPNITIAYADYYTPVLEMIRNPSDYGFDEGSKLRACCGTGGSYNFDRERKCGAGVPVCDDPSKFINWDGIHLTQAAYKVIADQLFSTIDFWKGWQSDDS